MTSHGARPPAYSIYASPLGNLFMTELAQILQSVLMDLGREVSLVRSGLPGGDPTRVHVVVAPHEYFGLLEGFSPSQLGEASARSVCVTTEQFGTRWFEECAYWCAASPLVLDINRTSAQALRERGLPVAGLPLGYHQSLDHWGGHDTVSRPRDAVFLGGATERRQRFLAHGAHLLWDRECEMRMFTFERPITDPYPGFLAGTQKLDYLAGTKLILNVHRGELRYFEWLRAIEAMANGCLVVTEESTAYEPLVAFEHFVQAPLDLLGEYASAILADEPWRQQLASAAYDMIRTDLDMTRTVGDLIDRLDACTAGSQSTSTAPTRCVQGALDAVAESAAAAPLEAASPVPPPQPSPNTTARALLGSLSAHERAAMAATKRLLLSERSLSRSIESVQSALRHGSDSFVTLDETPAYEQSTPDVSVVLTLYNYDRVVEDAINSVVASTGVTAELIVVDDHSRDGSVSTVRRLMGEMDWFPMLLVSKHANQGLSAARNSGFERARSDCVFVLDADNVLYPTGLRRLRDALTGSGNAMAYGIVDLFGECENLVSHLPWDPARLVYGNYIDAMTMVSKRCWEAAGGYDRSMDELYGGWEDFDLWLRFASLGYEASFVPTPVARYRVHSSSMLSAFNIEFSDVLISLRAKYPSLPWPAP